MSAKANPTLIGLFVVSGVALGIACLVLFSSSRLFTNTQDCIVYFDGSLNGLGEGAPVKLRGVTIGAVKKVMISFDQATNDYTMPVIIEFREDLLRERIGDAYKLENARDLQANIKQGLRATLGVESLVTGVLYVDLDTQLNAPPPVFHQLGKTYVEIPTRPSQTQQLLNNLAQVDIKGLESRLSSLITTIDEKVKALKAGEISDGITNLVASLDHVVRSPDFTNSIANLAGTLDRYRALADRIESRVAPVADGVTNTLAEVDQTLAQLRGAAEDLRGLLGPDAALRQDLSLALNRIATAAQSISELADYLQRHPNSLITGRKLEDQKP